MFENVEVCEPVSKTDYQEEEAKLRVELLTAQHRLLRESRFPVILKIAGGDRYGRHACMDLLHEWMDPRYLEANAYGDPNEAERLHPHFWRYWRRLPPRGQIGLFARAWTEDAIIARLRGDLNGKGLARRLESIRRLEKDLTDDGALILKVWLHLSKKALKDRIKEAERDPLKAWRTERDDRRIHEDYEKAMAVSAEVLEATHTPAAPWHILDSSQPRPRDLALGRLLRDTLAGRLSRSPGSASPAAPVLEPVTGPGALAEVDLTRKLEYDDYTAKRLKLQAKLSQLTRKANARGIPMVLAFEGWDAAGKGGIIRRLTKAIDASTYRVIPIAAPTDEEKRYHYLWRFWRRIPRQGNITMFDRTWYGRVLVERLEGFAKEHEWKRAYEEIRDFEGQLADAGVVVLKFWIHIDPDEQLRRFEARKNEPFKQYKITEEDFRNRARWAEYETAVNEMVARTHTDDASWHLIPANDKRWARVEVLKIVTRRLRRALKKTGD